MAKTAYTVREKTEMLKLLIQKNERERSENWKKGKEENNPLQKLAGSKPTRAYQWTLLKYCRPGTRFEVIGCPEVRGTLISVTEGSCRVLTDRGYDTRYAPGMEIVTLPPMTVEQLTIKKKSRTETKKDIFGTRIGSGSANINAALDETWQSIGDIARTSGEDVDRVRNYLRGWVREDGSLVNDGDNLYRLKPGTLKRLGAC